MLSGAGGGAETSLGERRRTQGARQRESAPPHFHPLTRPDKALGHSCGGRNLAPVWCRGVPCGRPCPLLAGQGTHKGCPYTCHRHSCENSATWPANTNDIRLRCRPAPPHFQPLTRPDKTLGHSAEAGTSQPGLRSAVLAEAQPLPPAVPALRHVALSSGFRPSVRGLKVCKRPVPAVIRQTGALSPTPVVAEGTRTQLNPRTTGGVVFIDVVTHSSDFLP